MNNFKFEDAIITQFCEACPNVECRDHSISKCEALLRLENSIEKANELKKAYTPKFKRCANCEHFVPDPRAPKYNPDAHMCAINNQFVTSQSVCYIERRARTVGVNSIKKGVN